MSPAKMRSRAKKRRVRSTPGPTRARILEAFSTKAKLMGIRAVMMAELASELRMSAATLYKEFPSKEHLAMACVNRWAHDLAASEAAKRDPKKPLGHFDQFMHWVDVWAASNAALSPVFRRDLETDYPAVWKRYREVVDERKRLGAALARAPRCHPGGPCSAVQPGPFPAATAW